MTEPGDTSASGQLSEQFTDAVLSGARWNALLRGTAQVVSWLSTIVVVRYVVPGDYGLNAMLEAPGELMFLVATLGIDSAMVRVGALEQRQLQSAFGWMLLMNLVLFLGYFFGAPLLADYFHEPRLELLAQVYSLSFLLTPFRAIPNALLDRELNFKSRAMVDLLASFAAAITSLTLAVLGFGIWALLSAILVNRLFASLLLMVLHPWFIRPTLDRAALPLIGFGGVMIASAVVALLSSRMGSWIAGPVMGVHLLGVYAAVQEFALLPISKAMPVMGVVIFPAFSRLSEHPNRAAHYLARAIEFASLLLFPVMVGLAATAHPFVDIVLGPNWHEVSLPLALLSLVMPMRLLTLVIKPVTSALGRPEMSLKSNLFSLALQAVTIPIGARYGVLGLTIAVAICEPLVMFFTLWLARGVLHVDPSVILRRTWPAVACVLLMVLAVLGMRYLDANLDTLTRLCLQVATGVVVYTGALLLFFRPLAWQLLNLLRGRTTPARD